ncbi:helix-turn-helix domain-containing protein [Candidatus Microgenomates bacterium]|nr:helix-turn-helix domain-containing protein [Candidatus Microgenomates bacterium]
MGNLYTVKQVAFILKVHPLTIRRYIREKKLTAVKFAGGVRIKEEDLQNFQRGYTTRKISVPLTKDLPKIFSLDDPLWQLDGIGGSLSLPTND